LDPVSELKKSFFNLTLDLLCVAGSDGYLKTVNYRWTEVLGYSEEELCSRPMTDFVHPEDVEKTVLIRKNFEAGKHITGFQNRYRCRDGTYRRFEWTAKKEGEFVIAVARDITSRLHETRMAALGELAAETGHAINNPLMIANFQVERAFSLLKKESDEFEKYRIFYESYKKASDRIATAVAKLRQVTDAELNSRSGDAVRTEGAKKILLVEDEEVLALLIKEELESEAVQVTLASNGLEALEVLKNYQFDVILTDASMPVMDGKSMIRAAHEMYLLPEECRVIVMTGAVEAVFSEDDYKTTWFKSCELLAKPVSGQALKKRLKLN
jgi:PAS domain S-box-containing protein